MPALVLILTLDQAVTQYGLQLLASLIIVTGETLQKVILFEYYPKL